MRPHVATLALAVAVLLAGCGGFIAGSESGDPAAAVTPAPVPADLNRTAPPAGSTATPVGAATDTDGWARAETASPHGYSTGVYADGSDVFVRQPRILSMRPTCDRPPGQVIHIQVTALDNNDPTTDAGINTTWRFLAPAYRQSFGTYRNFVDTAATSYRSVVTARTVAYGPLDRGGDVATQRVTVVGLSNSTTSYTWRVENQTSAPYEGCWMTTGITPVSSQ